MSMMETFKSDDYSDGRTKQSFKDSTDINLILARAAKGETISHLAKHGATYGDFTEIDDLLTAKARLDKGARIFQELPGELRREFDNDMGKFFNFVNDPQNQDRLSDVLPGLAKPGNQMPSPVRTEKSAAAEEAAVPPSAGAPPPAEEAAETPQSQ